VQVALPRRRGSARAASGGSSILQGHFAQAGPGEIGTFVLHGGETLALPLGEPLVPTVDVTLADGTAQFNYRLVGRSGEQYAPAVQKDKVQIPPPRLRNARTRPPRATSASVAGSGTAPLISPSGPPRPGFQPAP